MGRPLWAYRYRLDGRGSRRIQRGGYGSADDAREALQRALTATQRRKGCVRVTLADLAEGYLAQHDAEPETTAKLRWLLTKSIAAFGSTPGRPLRPLASLPLSMHRSSVSGQNRRARSDLEDRLRMRVGADTGCKL